MVTVAFLLQKLVDILERLDLDDEKNTLQTYLAFLKNANMMTVGRLDNLVKDNNDPLLLVLGSMAEFTTEKVCTVYVYRTVYAYQTFECIGF